MLTHPSSKSTEDASLVTVHVEVELEDAGKKELIEIEKHAQPVSSWSINKSMAATPPDKAAQIIHELKIALGLRFIIKKIGMCDVQSRLLVNLGS